MKIFKFFKKSVNKTHVGNDNNDNEKSNIEKIVVNDYESFMRKRYNESHKLPYKALKNIEEAKEFDQAYVIFEGDYGGIIYLTCPINNVKCSDKELQDLLKYIEEHYWNDLSTAGIYYEVLEKNQETIAGGMGGGKIKKGLWVNSELVKLGMANKIKKIICETDEPYVEDHILKSKEERDNIGGTAFIEIQYCKYMSSSKELNNPNSGLYEHGKENSMYIYIDDCEKFLNEYEKIFGHLDVYGFNYYDKEETKKIIKNIEKIHPMDYEIFVNWIEKEDSNGFWVLGI